MLVNKLLTNYYVLLPFTLAVLCQKKITFESTSLQGLINLLTSLNGYV